MDKLKEGNKKNSFYICIKFLERCPKDVGKIYLGEIRIMMFYGREFNAFYRIHYYNTFKV